MQRQSFSCTKILVALVGASAATLLADTPVPSKPRVDPHTIATLVKLGQDAFDAGDFAEARDAFSDAVQSDPTNLTVARDLAIVYLRLDKPAKATHLLEIASNTKVLDRSMVLALSAERVSAKSPMQAAKHILVYLDAHPTPPDEQMLNALGISLDRADAAGIKSALYTDAVKVCKKLNTKLEATRPGEKRWGIDWMPAADVDKKQSTVTAAQSTLRVDGAQLQKLDAQITETQRQKDAVIYTEGDNNQTQKKAAFQKQIDQLNVERTKVQNEFDEAQKTLADLKPHWPEEIPTDQLTLATALTPAAAPTAATPAAAPVEAPATPDATPDAKPKISSYHGTRYAAAFAVAPDLLVTASSAVADATDIEIQSSNGRTAKAEIVRSDAPSGLTLLRVAGAHYIPLPVAAANKPAPVKCPAFPDVSLFNPVEQELSGSANLDDPHPTVSLTKLPRLPGSPILQEGRIIAVELGDRDSDPKAIPVVALDALKTLLAADATATAPAADLRASVFQIAASR